MSYAKVLNEQLLVYPYTIGNFESENPYTNTDNIGDLVIAYSKTEDGIKTGANLVRVELGSSPVYDSSTQKISYGSMPIYKDGVWLLEPSIVPLTDQEIALIKNPQE